MFVDLGAFQRTAEGRGAEKGAVMMAEESRREPDADAGPLGRDLLTASLSVPTRTPMVRTIRPSTIGVPTAMASGTM